MQHREGEETAFKLSAEPTAKNKRSKRDESVFRRQAILVRGLSCQYIDIASLKRFELQHHYNISKELLIFFSILVF